MERNNNTIKSRKGKHLTYEERQKLEVLLKAKVDRKKIAELLGLGGRSERTIRREIERGTVQLLNSDLTERYEYSADAAQLKYERNAANKGRSLKIGRGHDLVAHIERKIGEEKMSPYAAQQSIENEGKEFSVRICLRTLYHYIVLLHLQIAHKTVIDGYALDAVLSFALNFGDIDSADQLFEQRRGQGIHIHKAANGFYK